MEADKEVTVDAINGNIYEGRVDGLVEAGKRENPFKDTAVFKLLRKLLTNIVPLNLIYPEDKKFSPDYCETFHDITRFAHEVAMREKNGKTVQLPGMLPDQRSRKACQLQQVRIVHPALVKR